MFCELTPDQMREMRGDLTTPAQSPYRDRPMEESLDLFARMRAGEFEDGRMTLRAKIDLASGNFNMRDPVIYRINHMPHHRTGTKWCIYPMYDFAHPIEDAMEHITHSLCSLEFEDHRPLYDWVINNVTLPAKPRQIEFARLGINNTVMSKRKLRALVEGGYVSGWDDPRMPTICGLPPPRLHPASHSQFQRAQRCFQGELYRGIQLSRALPARRPEPHGKARHGRSEPRKAHFDELSRR